MAKTELKFKAYELRRKGKSLKEIYSVLNVAKSTAANWCRDIEMTDEQKKTLRERMIQGGLSCVE